MQDLFAEQLEALRAASLDRHLRELAGAALCFSSGYAAALGTIPSLVTRDDVILLDKLCHASLIDGAKLSGAHLRVFPHNNLRKLESHLEWARHEHAGKRILIVTDLSFPWTAIARRCTSLSN